MTLFFFCQPLYYNVLDIKAILRCFELTSELRVNFDKSHVGALGVSPENLYAFSKCLNYCQMVLPFKYLGMPIGGNPKRALFWSLVIEKIKARLSRSKRRVLSTVGRVCLIKSLINALPLIYFSTYKAPSCICNQIRKLQASFLWGWGYEGRKNSWIGWKKVCNPNSVLLAKW